MSTVTIFSLLTICVTVTGVTGQHEVMVQTDLGLVQGYEMRSVNNRAIHAFEGIPYAEPPEGPLRFRAPVPKKPWDGTLQALKNGPICPQFKFSLERVSLPRFAGREDCLSLNVYVPKNFLNDKKDPQKLPVIVFIHGGSFTSGSLKPYGPAYLLDKDVILVTMNYRVGVLGFLSTGDDENPGNNGLKDQALAIEWVGRNIGAFGGDPNSITLMGQSAGASSVHYHLMSDNWPSKRLIKRAIMLSGVSTNPWAYDGPNEARQKMVKFASLNGCDVRDGSKVVMNCLRRRSTPFLIFNQMLMNVDRGITLPTWFSPVVEFPKSSNQQPFLTVEPHNAYKEGKVAGIPVMVSWTSGEFDFIEIGSTLLRGDRVLANMYYQWAPVVMEYDGKVKRVTETSEKIAQFYGNGKPLRDFTGHDFSEILNDRNLRIGVLETIAEHSRIAPTFAQEYSYQSQLGSAGTLGLDSRNFGVLHGEDLKFLFNDTNEPIFPGSRSKKPELDKMLPLHLELITTFAISGEPQCLERSVCSKMPAWTSVKTEKNPEFLRLRSESRMTQRSRFESILQFWNSLNISTDLLKDQRSEYNFI